LEPTTLKDSARLLWNAKQYRRFESEHRKFQTSEIVLLNPSTEHHTFCCSQSKIQTRENNSENRLIWGNNLFAMHSLLTLGYEGKINLIYIDPPFWTNEKYYTKYEFNASIKNQISFIIERLAYKDIWKGRIDSFLDMLYPRLQLMRRLLAENGSIFIHLDYHIGHYVKVVMDEIFGASNFRNEIIVKRGRKKGLMYQFEKVDRMHASYDTILWYTKSSLTKFNHPLSYKEGVDAKWMGFWSNVDRPNLRYDLFGIVPNRGQWKWKKERAFKAVENYHKFEIEFKNNIDKSTEFQTITKQEIEFMKNKYLLEYWRSTGQTLEFIRMREGVKYPEYWVEPREQKILDNLWTDIEAYSYSSNYPTEKHTDLLERIIVNFSNKGDLIADFFAGSGTTLVVAEKNERRWIGCDFSKVAIQVTRNRLIQRYSKPFLIQNIGRRQRELIYLAGFRIHEIQRIILKLYGATIRNDYPDLACRKINGLVELVYISYPDRPVTAKKVDELESLAEKIDGIGYQQLVILGWEYEYNYDEALYERERLSKRIWRTKIVSKIIPHEAYEYLKKHKTVDEFDPLHYKIQFHRKPYLKLLKPEIQYAVERYHVTVGIDRYVVFDIPIKKQKYEKGIEALMKKGSLSLIDYWAIDWDYDGKTFKSTWQASRGIGRNILPIPKSANKGLKPGKVYVVAVRVVDVFGNVVNNILKIDLQKRINSK
jgi:adenine-specific DNA-methyltransferase